MCLKWEISLYLPLKSITAFFILNFSPSSVVGNDDNGGDDIDDEDENADNKKDDDDDNNDGDDNEYDDDDDNIDCKEAGSHREEQKEMNLWKPSPQLSSVWTKLNDHDEREEDDGKDIVFTRLSIPAVG